jgi:hypothetical protein
MKKYRCYISYLSICILVLNIGLASAVSLNDDKILLCTSQGYVWVTVSEMNSELAHSDLIKSDNSGVQIHKCPFCTTHTVDNDDIIQSFYGPKPYQYFYSKRLKSSVSVSSSDTQYYSSHQSRAPPFPI